MKRIFRNLLYSFFDLYLFLLHLASVIWFILYVNIFVGLVFMPNKCLADCTHACILKTVLCHKTWYTLEYFNKNISTIVNAAYFTHFVDFRAETIIVYQHFKK